MKIVLYPGTFDPIHKGHIDICEKASKIFDKVIFAVAENPNKKTLFSAIERVEMIKNSTNHISNVETASTSGLIADFAKKMGACALIRGLRHVSDFEFEFQLALMNRRLKEQIETIFMMPKDRFTFLSSSIVKEIASLGGSIDGLVPDPVHSALKERFQQQANNE